MELDGNGIKTVQTVKPTCRSKLKGFSAEPCVIKMENFPLKIHNFGVLVEAFGHKTSQELDTVESQLCLYGS